MSFVAPSTMGVVLSLQELSAGRIWKGGVMPRNLLGVSQGMAHFFRTYS